MNKFNYIFILVGLMSCSDTNESESVNGSNVSSIELQNSSVDLSVGEFVKWVADEENSLLKNKKISELDYQLSYLPAACLAYMELKNEQFSMEKLDTIKQHYADMSYFNFRISLKKGQGELLKYNLGSAQEYEQRLNYISFNMQKDVMIIQNNDTVYPGLYHYERIFEVAPYATVMVAFDKKQFNPSKEFTFVFNDKLLKKGLIKFTYKDNQLIDLPNITGV